MWKMWDMLRRLSVPALGALGLLALVHGTGLERGIEGRGAAARGDLRLGSR